MQNLYEEFSHFMGQPVKICTDDGRCFAGIVIDAYDHSVRVIDECGCLILIEYCHITAVMEPQMKLCNCRKADGCETRKKKEKAHCGCDHEDGDEGEGINLNF